MTTPLEREILSWYFCGRGPYLNGSENWRDVHSEIISGFIELGLLVSVTAIEGVTLAHIEANYEALKPYMLALADVPLPVQRWVVPTTQREGEKT